MKRRDLLTGAAGLAAGGLFTLGVAAGEQRSEPTSSEPPGAPFGNPNLKLAVLNALMRSGDLKPGTPAELARRVHGREVDLESDGWELDARILDHFLRWPLDAAMLDRVEFLGFDGGNEIYHYIWYHWNGESSDFDLDTIRGIEHCPRLRRFNEISMIKYCDLALLRPLQCLESVELAPGAHPNARALLDLPKLQSLSCFGNSLDEPDVLAALRARGVKVKIWT